MKSLLPIVLIALIGIGWFAHQANQPRSAVSSTEPANFQPVISRHDILTATDFTAGIQSAVKRDKPTEINKWFNKATELAEQARLPEEDIAYLRSDLAKKVAVFAAKRQLFNQEIEQAYYSVGDIQSIKDRYPEAQDLFAEVDGLIQQRNRLIQDIASEIAGSDAVTDQSLQTAKDQWQARFADKAQVTSLQ